jgi:hypothetical protein
MKGVTMLRRWTLPLVTIVTLAIAAAAGATAPPVGPLPRGPVTTISAPKGSLVSVALPAGANGRVWRQARPLDAKVLRQVSEADVGQSVVIVFKAVGRGSTKVVYGLTRGETRKAYAAATFVVKVR